MPDPQREQQLSPLDKAQHHLKGAQSDVARIRGEVARANQRLEQAIRMEARMEQWVYELEQGDG